MSKLSSDERVSYAFIHVFDKLEQKKLDSLRTVATGLKDRRLLDYLMLFENMPKTETRPYSEQLRIYKSIEEKVEQSPFDDIKGTYYWFRGMNAFYNKDPEKALPLISLSRKLLEKAGYRSYNHFCYYYYGTFSMYYSFGDYQSAAECCIQAINNSGTYSFSNGRKAYYDNLGECYVKLKKYDQAKAAFLQAMLEAEKEAAPHFKALVIGNLGNLLRLQGKYKESLPYLYFEASTNEKAIPENAAMSRLYIANALLHLDSVEKSRAFLNPPNIHLPSWVFPDYDLIRLETWALYHQKTANYQAASRYKDSLLALKDSLKTVYDFRKLSALESEVQAEKYMDDRKKLELRAGQERLIRNLVIAGLVLLFAGIFIWLWNRRRTEKLLAGQKLLQANAELEQYLKHILEKNELIERLSARLRQENESNPSEIQEGYLKELSNSVILTEDNWQEFKKLFETAFPDFFLNLGKQYPGLTPAEVRLLALEKLQLSTRDMANMLGISADSIRKNRYRLRKKFPESIPQRTAE